MTNHHASTNSSGSNTPVLKLAPRYDQPPTMYPGSPPATTKQQQGTFVAQRLTADELASIPNVAALGDLINSPQHRCWAPSLQAFVNAGVEDELTLERNKTAFHTAFALQPRVLKRSVAHVDTATTILQGRATLRSPVMVAPFSACRAMHPEGEHAVVRAAMQAGIAYVIPQYAGYPVKELVATAYQACTAAKTTTTGNKAALPVLLFQVYPHKPRKGHAHEEGMDRHHMAALVQYIAGIHYKHHADCILAIMFTCDTPNNGNREKTYASTTWAHDLAVQCGGFPTPLALKGGAGLPKIAHDNWGHAQSMTWNDIQWMVAECRKYNMALVLKGILHAEDAKQAAKLGVDAVVISNHGGRQLDGTLGTLQVLEECVYAVRSVRGSDCEVWIDGGIRRGQHIVQCLALGATCVLMARPFAWGVAAAGTAGVERVMEMLHHELVTAMQLCGCATVADVRQDRPVVELTTTAGTTWQLRRQWKQLQQQWMVTAAAVTAVVAMAAFGLGRYSVSSRR